MADRSNNKSNIFSLLKKLIRRTPQQQAVTTVIEDQLAAASTLWGALGDEAALTHPAAALYHRLLNPAYARIVRYADYEFMELCSPEVAHALNIFSGEAVLGTLDPSTYFKCFSESPDFNSEVEKLLQIWIEKTEELTGMTFPALVRRFLKMGDIFLVPVFLREDTERQRAVGYQILPEEQVARVFVLENKKEYFILDPTQKKLPPVATLASVQTPVTGLEGLADPWATPIKDFHDLEVKVRSRNGMILELEDVLHFRLQPDMFFPLGTSILERARLPWRQLRLLEDSLVVYRIVRAPERLVFKVQTGKMPPKEQEAYLQMVRKSLRKSLMAKPDSELNLSASPLVLGIIEDLFIPVREGFDISVESLAKGGTVGEIDDVLMFRDKLAQALGLPKELIYGEASAEVAKAMVFQDLRFATQVKAIQTALCAEFTRAVKLHYARLGRSTPVFRLSLASPLGTEEATKLEAMRGRFDLVSAIRGLNIEGYEVNPSWLVSFLNLPSEALRPVQSKSSSLEAPEPTLSAGESTETI